MAVNWTVGRYAWWLVLIAAFMFAIASVYFLVRLGQNQKTIEQSVDHPSDFKSVEMKPDKPVETTNVSPATVAKIAFNDRDVVREQSRLQRIRREFNYPLNGVKVTESGLNGAISQTVVAEDPLVLQALQQWFLDDPEGFVEAAASEERDSYLQAVLQTQINESNVHLLTGHLYIRNRHIITVAYQNKLHLQEPDASLDIFDQFAKNNVIRLPASLIAAAAEVDYWGRRETLLAQAIGNPEPGMYFDVLQQQGKDNMPVLAEQMWAVHLADNYAEDVRPDTGYLERTRLAYQYGVTGSPRAIAELQAKGLFVNETIREFTDVKNAEERFQDIHSALVFEQTKQRWVLP